MATKTTLKIKTMSKGDLEAMVSKGGKNKMKAINELTRREKNT